MIADYRQAENVLGFVASEYGVTVQDLKSRRRWRNVLEARLAAYQLLRRLTTLSYPEIGRLMKRDHSTVVICIQRGRGQREADELERRLGFR